jgi:hypothetical protein
MADLRELAESFLAESRVFRGLYGRTYSEQLDWALDALPLDSIEHYMESWWHGRQAAQRYLRWMAEHLSRQAGAQFAALPPPPADTH